LTSCQSVGMLAGMTDDNAALPSADSPPTIENDTPAPAAPFMNLPLGMFVKGGTTSSRHDAHMAAMEADSAKRRAESDAEKKIAKAHAYRGGTQGEIATLMSHEFTDHPEIGKAYVPLMYMSASGKEVDYYGTGDILLVQDPKILNELMVILFCPKCRSNGLAAGHCLIQVRQSNRHWELDQRTAGELFIDVDGEPQRSAGVIMDSDKFTCARCNWSACIDKNRVITR